MNNKQCKEYKKWLVTQMFRCEIKIQHLGKDSLKALFYRNEKKAYEMALGKFKLLEIS